MNLHIIDNVPAWNELATEWNDLLAHSVTPVPFLRHEYLAAWWMDLGANEWPRGELHIVTARVDGVLMAAAPLFASVDADNEPLLTILGSDHLADYLDLMARPEHLAPFVKALVAHLGGPAAPPWRALEFYNIRDSSLSLPELAAAAAARDWTCTLKPIIQCSSVSLPGNWATYLASQLDKKQRHEIRRKMRRAEEAGPIRWYIADDPARLGEEVDALFRLMAFHEDKEQMLCPAVRALLERMIRAAFDRGWLQLAFLEISGRKAAVFMNFDYDNRIWVCHSGMDPAFQGLAPGIVLLGYLLQWANDRGRSAFDFLRGEEPYKRHFGASFQQVWRLTIEKSQESD